MTGVVSQGSSTACKIKFERIGPTPAPCGTPVGEVTRAMGGLPLVPADFFDIIGPPIVGFRGSITQSVDSRSLCRQVGGPP
jgi:hypothetical protein